MRIICIYIRKAHRAHQTHRPIKDVITLQADIQHMCHVLICRCFNATQFYIVDVIRYVPIEMRKFINNPAKADTHIHQTKIIELYRIHNSHFSPLRLSFLFRTSEEKRQFLVFAKTMCQIHDFHDFHYFHF